MKDQMNLMTTCPNCKREVKREHLFMCSGYTGCPHCFSALRNCISEHRRSKDPAKHMLYLEGKLYGLATGEPDNE